MPATITAKRQATFQGPASSTDNAIVRFDLATGNIIQNSGVLIDDSNNVTIPDAANIIVGSTTGTKIGTATTQKLGFFNSTPIAQPSSTTDLRTALINLGLYATGGASPLNLNGGAFTAASITNTSVTLGSIVFSGAGGLMSQDNANLFWDDTNNRLGVGTAAPGSLLEVAGKGQFGTAAATTAQVVIKGGSGGNSMFTLERTSGATISFSWLLAGGGLTFKDDTNNKITTNIFGDSSLNQIYLGQKGKTTVEANNSLIAATTHGVAAGTDVAGTWLKIQGGLGTGAGVPGDIFFSMGDVGLTGTTAHSATTKMTIKATTGNVGIGTTSPLTPLHVVGATTKTGSTNNRATDNKILYGATTDAVTNVELTTDGAAGSGATNRIAVPANTALSVVLNICVKQATSANAKQMLRQFVISNNAGTTTIQGTVVTLGTDGGSAGLTTVACVITANDTDDCIKIEVTGVAATNLRYTAYLVSTEVLYT